MADFVKMPGQKQFRNPLMAALFDVGMPVWTRDDGWMKRAPLENKGAAIGVGGQPDAPNALGMQPGAQMGRPRGGLMGLNYRLRK
jgi:hypothetical protein